MKLMVHVSIRILIRYITGYMLCHVAYYSAESFIVLYQRSTLESPFNQFEMIMAARALNICASSAILALNRAMLSRAVSGKVATFDLTSTRKFSTNRVIMSKAFVQKPAPAFSAKAVDQDGEFVDIKLSDYKGKYLVLFFYPLDFTFVCPTEIIAFSDRAEEFRAINCEVVACSVDSHFCHLAWTSQPRKKGGLGQMDIPILSDITKQISKDYGVLLEDQGISLRGLFIVDDKGILRQITVNDLPVGRSVDETLRLVQAFQFTDKHGEVCPAGWKPGSDTIKPDVKKGLEYFSKQVDQNGR